MYSYISDLPKVLVIGGVVGVEVLEVGDEGCDAGEVPHVDDGVRRGDGGVVGPP